MGKKDAEALDVPKEDKTRYVRLDDAKGNMSPPAQGARWFERKGVALPNANDKLGLELDEVDLSISHEDSHLILEEV